MRRGSYGAFITEVTDEIHKRVAPGDDPTRVVDQGHWLQQHTSPAVPHVDRVYASSYVMERLTVPPIHLLDHERVLRVMINQLQTHIWSRPPVAPINHNMLQLKIDKLLHGHDGFDCFWSWLYKTHAGIAWG